MWQLQTSQGEMAFDIVILANGPACIDWPVCQSLPLRLRPGQLSIVKASKLSTSLKAILHYGGYITPQVNHQHVMGATYRRDPSKLAVTIDDHQENIDKLARINPGIGTTIKRSYC